MLLLMVLVLLELMEVEVWPAIFAPLLTTAAAAARMSCGCHPSHPIASGQGLAVAAFVVTDRVFEEVERGVFQCPITREVRVTM